MRKRIIVVILCLAMAVNLVACGNTDTAKVQELENKIEELEAEIEELEEENEELRAQNKEIGELSVEEAITFVAETSGVCGSNATWEYGNGVLKIHGTGEMTDFDYNNRPWENMKDKIQHIYIDEGITSIGEFAFYDMPLLSKLVIPDSVKEISTVNLFGVTSAAAPADMSDEEKKEYEDRIYFEALNRKLAEIKEIAWGDKTYISIEEFISEIY